MNAEQKKEIATTKAAAALGAKGGRAKTAVKAAAVRENGKLGGKPVKFSVEVEVSKPLAPAVEGAAHEAWRTKREAYRAELDAAGKTGNPRRLKMKAWNAANPEPQLEKAAEIQREKYRVFIGGGAARYSRSEVQAQATLAVNMGDAAVLICDRRGKYHRLPIVKIEKI